MGKVLLSIAKIIIPYSYFYYDDIDILTGLSKYIEIRTPSLLTFKIKVLGNNSIVYGDVTLSKI